VTPEYFGIVASLTFLAFAYMGGISSVTGAVIGGFLVTNGMVFTALDKWIGISPNYAILIGGLGLIVTVVTNPEGIAGTWRGIGHKLQARRASSDTPPGRGGGGSRASVDAPVAVAPKPLSSTPDPTR
jgi:branched-chain amino acid transport system permease protein